MYKRFTHEEYIEKARKIHGDDYDYSEVKYVNAKTKIKLFHKKCGRFYEQFPRPHLMGQCPICSGKFKSNTDEFVQRAKELYKNEFDYGLVNYVSAGTKVEIKHNKCGKVFKQTPYIHLKSGKCACCWHDKYTCDKEKFIKKAISLHGDEYDYDTVEYFGTHKRVKIKHNKCGKIFEQTPHGHLGGSRCLYCHGNERNTDGRFVEKAKIVHDNKYDYNEVEYIDSFHKVKIRHLKCNKYFLQAPFNHLNGVGCPFCNESKMEKLVRKYLTDKKIDFESQKKYEDCKDKRPLPFDFYLPEFNVLIECQGKQHYMPILNWNRKNFTEEQAFEQFEDRIKKDNIKRIYAKKCGIKLIEINYKDKIKIQNILDVELKGTLSIGKEQHENKQLVFELHNENNGVNYVR